VWRSLPPMRHTRVEAEAVEWLEALPPPVVPDAEAAPAG
jgi:ATP-dependent DNA helicase DinG